MMAPSGRGYAPGAHLLAPEFDPEQDYAPLPSPTREPNGTGHHFTQQTQQPWSSGICACCDDMNSCCLGFWCPCILFSKNVELLEGRHWTGPCLMHILLWGIATGIGCSLTSGTMLGLLGSCVPCYACGYRKILRTNNDLEEAPCGDFLTHLFCHQCAICQEYREICDRSSRSGFSMVAPSNQTMEERSLPTSNGLQIK